MPVLDRPHLRCPSASAAFQLAPAMAAKRPLAAAVQFHRRHPTVPAQAQARALVPGQVPAQEEVAAAAQAVAAQALPPAPVQAVVPVAGRLRSRRLQ